MIQKRQLCQNKSIPLKSSWNTKRNIADKSTSKLLTSRLSQKLIKENRLKGRKLGAGAKPLLDSEDEEFVSNATASKSTCHGRRKDATLYLHYGVKCEGLLTLTNYSLYKRGRKLIKSALTIYMRGRPKRLRVKGTGEVCYFVRKSLPRLRLIPMKQLCTRGHILN